MRWRRIPMGLLLVAIGICSLSKPVNAVESFSPVTELLLFSDEIMVMSATKRLQKLSEVPGSVTIITEKEIKQSGALTIFEALRNLADITIINEGLFNTIRFRSMQAAYNNKILVLIDGRKVNTMDWGNFDGDLGINLANVKQIEVIKGPGSSLYGANAYAGVISIVTKDGAEIGGLKTDISVGNKPGDREVSQKYSLTYGKKMDDLDCKISASYWRASGIDLYDGPHPNDLFDGEEASFALKYKDDWMVQGGYHKSSSPWNGSEYNPTPKNTEDLEQLYLDGTYSLALNDLSKLKLHLTDNYNLKRYIHTELWNLDRQKINTINDLPSPAPIMIVTDKGNTEPIDNAVGGYYIGLNDFLRVIDSSALSMEDLGLGRMNEFMADLQYDLAWPQNNYLLAGLSLKYDWSNQDYFKQDVVTDTNYAVYLQDEYHLGDQLILLSGIRYDYNQDYGSNTSPRESLIYEPLKGLRMKALYGSAFRAPVILERYTLTDYGFYEATGNLDLKPESIQQSEASVEYENGQWLKAKAGYFYWETANEIQFDYTMGRLFVYSPDLSLISPLMPALPGLLYAGELNAAPALVSWGNANSRIGHGLELETTITPNEFTQIQLNYSRTTLYARNRPQAPEWAEGVADIANAIVGLHFKDLVFMNFYAHAGRSPMTVNVDPDAGLGLAVEAHWLQQYDISLGGQYEGFSLVATAFNIFHNAIVYDSRYSQSLEGPTIYRLNASYTLKF